jgi:phosphatidylglycerophosphate synthase
MTSPISKTPGQGSPGEPGSLTAAPAVPAKPPEVEELVDEYLHRPIARRIVDLLVHTPITPNQVTLIAALVGVMAGVLMGMSVGRPDRLLLSGLLLFASVVLDCCDGQLARRKKISSTYGAILDGIGDYAVGISLGIGATVYIVGYTGKPLLWFLGLAGIVSSAVQSALFDHSKTRYIAKVGRGYTEREENLDLVDANRRAALAERRYRDAFLLWVYLGYSRAQHAAMAISPAVDPVAYRAAHAGRMRLWTFQGIGTHFAFAYLTAIAGYWWQPGPILYFIGTATVFNLLLLYLMLREPGETPG